LQGNRRLATQKGLAVAGRSLCKIRFNLRFLFRRFWTMHCMRRRVPTHLR
jgi:hypothetical protein